MNDSNRKHEKSVKFIILDLLSTHETLSTQRVTKFVKDRVELSSGDMTQANRRPNECKFDKIVANALHAERVLCARGLIRRVDRGVFKITDRGQKILAELKKKNGN